MTKRLKQVLFTMVLTAEFLLVGCSAMSPEQLTALGNDGASFCAVADARGGVGAVAGAPAGGYGQATLTVCRTNSPNSTLTVGPNGTMSIQHNLLP